MSMGFFALLDDIALLLDDTAAISKIAAKKTASVLGDDLAVNAQKASGFAASRELPVLYAITIGSLKNKAIILPFAFLFSIFIPWIIIPILMLGGVYLAYEGFEKIYEYFFHKNHIKKIVEKVELSKEEILNVESEKIKSAITTDFILSIEIIIIALSTVVEQNIFTQIIVVSFIALLATVGVYGLVAFIVRLDDMGLKLIEIAHKKKSKLLIFIGNALVQALPKIIRALSVIGTMAMLLVAGGIFVHHLHFLHEFLHFMPALGAELFVGLVLGAIAFFVKLMFRR